MNIRYELSRDEVQEIVSMHIYDKLKLEGATSRFIKDNLDGGKSEVYDDFQLEITVTKDINNEHRTNTNC